MRHLRSCAASASGKSSTGSGATSNIYKTCDCVILEAFISAGVSVLENTLQALISEWIVLQCMLKLVWRTTLQIITRVWVLWQYAQKLMPCASPLEMGACVVLLDADGSGYQSVQAIFAGFVLFLAQCEWHVPSSMPYDDIVCRLFSALCMHGLYPQSITLICWALAHPTFGKRAKTTSASASHDSVPGSGASDEASTRPDAKLSLDDIITKCEAMEGTTELGERILAAAITLRDSRGRDRLPALRAMTKIWNVSRQEMVGDEMKDRGLADLAKDLETAVCEAAREWMTDTSRSQTSQSADAEASATADT